jgi:penicillin V acylase-like amidase (Ntn superfamily)
LKTRHRIALLALIPTLLALIALGTAARGASACTTFCLRGGGEVLFGRNYDWEVGDGLVLVNKRGVAKTALPVTGARPATWTSRFGSVTFNQYGREVPTGGMNEAGLVVELMWLDVTRYSPPDRRPAIGALEWIQYQLDVSGKVEDVLKAAAAVRIDSEQPIHYLVCDRTGACTTVEILNGKLAARSGAALPVPVLTNDTYDESLRFLARAGEQGPEVAGPGSLQRFARAAGMVRRASAGKPTVASTFAMLDQLSQGPHTKWSMVYDMARKRIHYRTRANRAVRSLDLAAFDFSCRTPVRMLDIDAGSGDVTRRFADYRPAANRDLIQRSFRKTPFLAGSPPEAITALADHPASTTCRR